MDHCKPTVLRAPFCTSLLVLLSADVVEVVIMVLVVVITSAVTVTASNSKFCPLAAKSVLSVLKMVVAVALLCKDAATSDEVSAKAPLSISSYCTSTPVVESVSDLPESLRLVSLLLVSPCRVTPKIFTSAGSTSGSGSAMDAASDCLIAPSAPSALKLSTKLEAVDASTLKERLPPTMEVASAVLVLLLLEAEEAVDAVLLLPEEAVVVAEIGRAHV